MTGLARRLAVALPTEAASPPAWRGHPGAHLPFEVPPSDRMTTDPALVTCPGPEGPPRS